jgi:hypothetical protein
VMGLGDTPTSFPHRTEQSPLEPKSTYSNGGRHPWFEGNTTNAE